MSELSRKVAVFIDAENTAARLASVIMEHAAVLGRIAFARVYGKAAHLMAWEPAMKEHGIRAVPTPAAATKKNASDFSLTIDAVGTLHEMRYDHALIVTKDGDFLQLVLHIKDNGAWVTCASESHGAPSLRKHCDGWIALVTADAVKAPKTKVAAPVETAKAKTGGVARIDVVAVRRHFEDFAAAQPGDIKRDGFIKHLTAKMPGAKKGYRTWPNFLGATGLFEHDSRTGALRLKQ